MSDLVGRVVSNRYRILECIGHGGMADVYKVWDPKRATHLAMKVLRADLAEDVVFLRRFKREAQTLEKLQHPNIVRVYGLEEDGDLAFILMDFIEGITLRTEIHRRGQPFPQERVLEIMRPVCAALHYAHQSGVVHCDVKPANIMIDASGRILVSDFGIARASEATTATMVGAGTPAYMSPEMARGENPTPQADIYALGVILFEMLTGGERPFSGEYAGNTGSTGEKIRWEQINLEPPHPSVFNPKVQPELETVVLCCLQKDAWKRYPSAQDLLNALSFSAGNLPPATVTMHPLNQRLNTNPGGTRPPAPPPAPLPVPAAAAAPAYQVAPAAPYPPVSSGPRKNPLRKYVPYLMVGISTLLVIGAIAIAMSSRQPGTGAINGIKNPPAGTTLVKTFTKIPRPANTATSAAIKPLLLNTATRFPTVQPTATPRPTETPRPTATTVPTATRPRPTLVYYTETPTDEPSGGGGGGGGGGVSPLLVPFRDTP